MRTRSSVFIPFVTALTLAGCFGELPDEDAGQALAEVPSIPTGVGCLGIV